MVDPAPLTAFYELLRRTEPVHGEYDVAWHGPWVVERGRKWWPTTFTLYRGVLYGTICTDNRDHAIAWNIADGEPAPDERVGGEAAWAWKRALPRLLAQLRSAVENPDAYNRRIERQVPLDCRQGSIRRGLTWPKGFAPVPRRILREARRALEDAGTSESLPTMTVRKYLEIAAIAYDAAFLESRMLVPELKHRRWADQRHGGMMSLPPNDPDAFAAWHQSDTWRGAHPWEIVFGYPLGIHLWTHAPVPPEGGWRLSLGVYSEGLYASAVRMALALCRSGHPVALDRRDEVFAALLGEDDVLVSPRLGQVSLHDLRDSRPDSVQHVRWDPIPRIEPITPLQSARVEHVEATGTPVDTA